ncbi:MAG: hypothetical protein LQ341_004084 [Variospora aurantia]|nr:MAG: hypothetical protein LQ341_004084 [Variospora aurantia]
MFGQATIQSGRLLPYPTSGLALPLTIEEAYDGSHSGRCVRGWQMAGCIMDLGPREPLICCILSPLGCNMHVCPSLERFWQESVSTLPKLKRTLKAANNDKRETVTSVGIHPLGSPSLSLALNQQQREAVRYLTLAPTVPCPGRRLASVTVRIPNLPAASSHPTFGTCRTQLPKPHAGTGCLEASRTACLVPSRQMSTSSQSKGGNQDRRAAGVDHKGLFCTTDYQAPTGFP